MLPTWQAIGQMDANGVWFIVLGLAASKLR
jgi:hypothetical protein